MADLFTQYSLTEIIIFLSTFALAFKSVVSFWDWSIERIKNIFNQQNAKEKNKENIQQQLDKSHKQIQNLQDSQKKIFDQLFNLNSLCEELVDSNKDTIKSYIVKEHHYFCYEQKWIDDFSLDCLERQYKHYVAEGGNTFVSDLMEDIRDLPNQPPKKEI